MNNNLILNDQKKQDIIKSLDEEINEMRKKYILKQPNEVKPIKESKLTHENFQNNDTFGKKTNYENNNSYKYLYNQNSQQPKVINYDTFHNNSDGEYINEYDQINKNDKTNEMNFYSQGDIEINEIDMNDMYLNNAVDEIDYLGDFNKNKNEPNSKYKNEIQTLGDDYDLKSYQSHKYHKSNTTTNRVSNKNQLNSNIKINKESNDYDYENQDNFHKFQNYSNNLQSENNEVLIDK